MIKKAKEKIAVSKKLAGTNLNLESLDLTTKDLTELIPTIANELPNLSYLSLYGNVLESLPDNLSLLSNLMNLNCSNNNLKDISSISQIRSLQTLNLKNNDILDVPDSIKNITDLHHVTISRNPLSLKSLLTISAIDNSQEMFVLDTLHVAMRNRILEQPWIGNIAISIADTYQKISIEQFNTFYNSLKNAKINDGVNLDNILPLSIVQIRGIVEFKLSLSDLGIGFDSNGNLSKELKPKYSNSRLSELIGKADEIMELTKKSSQEAFNFVDEKSTEYLDGILIYGLSESQLEQIDSVENLKVIYKRINEAISEKHNAEEEIKLANPTEEQTVKDIANLNEEDKAFASNIFNNSIEEYISKKGNNYKEKKQTTGLKTSSGEATTLNLDDLIISKNSGDAIKINSKGKLRKKTKESRYKLKP